MKLLIFVCLLSIAVFELTEDVKQSVNDTRLESTAKSDGEESVTASHLALENANQLESTAETDDVGVFNETENINGEQSPDKSTTAEDDESSKRSIKCKIPCHPLTTENLSLKNAKESTTQVIITDDKITKDFLALVIGIPVIVVLSIVVVTLLVVIICTIMSKPKRTKDETDEFDDFKPTDFLEESSQKSEDQLRLTAEPEPRSIASLSLKPAAPFVDTEMSVGGAGVESARSIRSDYHEEPGVRKRQVPFGWVGSKQVFKTAKIQQQPVAGTSTKEASRRRFGNASTMNNLTTNPPIESITVISPSSLPSSISESFGVEEKESISKLSSASGTRKSKK